MSEQPTANRLDQQVIIRKIEEAAYTPVWHAMQDFTEHRHDQSLDEIWLVEHSPVFTQGQAGKPDHLLAPGDIEVVKVDRGGQVTYHGPGQCVVYLMIDIRRKDWGVRGLVDRIEQVVVTTLGAFGIQGAPKPKAPGVYVDEKKICSLGLRIRKGCSFHGLALNVAMDLEPFLRINPCGYEGLAMTHIQDYEPSITMARAEQVLIEQLTQTLDYSSWQTVNNLDGVKTYE